MELSFDVEHDSEGEGKSVDLDKGNAKGKGKGKEKKRNPPCAYTEPALPTWLDTRPTLFETLKEAIEWTKESHKQLLLDAQEENFSENIRAQSSNEARSFEQQVHEKDKAVEGIQGTDKLEEAGVMPAVSTSCDISVDLNVRISGSDWPEEVSFILQGVSFVGCGGRPSTGRDLCMWATVWEYQRQGRVNPKTQQVVAIVSCFSFPVDVCYSPRLFCVVAPLSSNDTH